MKKKHLPSVNFLLEYNQFSLRTYSSRARVVMRIITVGVRGRRRNQKRL